MATEVVTLAGSSNGSLASVSSALAGVGSAGKAFVLAHPTTMAVTGGVLLGMGAYYTLGKVFRKKEPAMAEVTPTPA